MLKAAFWLASLFAVVASAGAVWAQDVPSLGGVAVNLVLADQEATSGDIVSITPEGFVRSKVAYDTQMYGVVVEAPILSVEPKTDATKAVVSSGEVDVKVSAGAGPIRAGDFITTSDEPGVGVKASASGYVLGKALADWEDTSQTGLIPVAVDIGPGQGGIGAMTGLLQKLFGDPENFRKNIRYVLAALGGVIMFGVAAFSFVRFMTTGIEAIGRNPLAKRTIFSSMVLSGVVVVVLAIAGIGITVAVAR